ncbi:MAG: hypothetical protein QOF16_581 [Actinomycetota bacterium]|nr:hypothetical protein [Actinomycetota bacterium]
MNLSVMADLRDLKRAFTELFAPSPEDEHASYQLAVSARKFSKRTKAVVDDKLTFSATLMRAGEVDAAHRLLEDFERDVRDEEAALIECVNEVKAAGAVRKQFELRRRVAGLAAIGLIGSSVLGVSAASMAAVGMFKERATNAQQAHRAQTAAAAAGSSHGSHSSNAASKVVRKVKIAGVNVTLRGDQVAAFKALTTGAAQSGEIRRLLVLLPDAVAARVQKAINVVTAAVPSPSAPAQVSKVLKKQTHPKHNAAQPTPSQSPQPDSSDQSGSSDPPHKTTHHGSHNSHDGGNGGQGDNIPVPPLPGGSPQG